MARYAKRPFSGNPDDRAYLLGLRSGGLYADRHGRSIRVTVSTTHPAMLELMKDIFGKYARVVLIPKFIRRRKQFEWEVYSYLHSSFEFLLAKTTGTNDSFLSFLAGFFDAEGSVSIKRGSSPNTTRVVVEVSSTNLGLSRFLNDQLHKLGYHPYFPPKPTRREGDVVGCGPYTRDFSWRLSINGTREAVELLSSLPIRHREKTLKKEPRSDIITGRGRCFRAGQSFASRNQKIGGPVHQRSRENLFNQTQGSRLIRK